MAHAAAFDFKEQRKPEVQAESHAVIVNVSRKCAEWGVSYRNRNYRRINSNAHTARNSSIVRPAGGRRGRDAVHARVSSSHVPLCATESAHRHALLSASSALSPQFGHQLGVLRFPRAHDGRTAGACRFLGGFDEPFERILKHFVQSFQQLQQTLYRQSISALQRIRLSPPLRSICAISADECRVEVTVG